MAGGCREWVRADDAQRVGNMGSSYFLSPWPMWRPLSNKQTNNKQTMAREWRPSVISASGSLDLVDFHELWRPLGTSQRVR